MEAFDAAAVYSMIAGVAMDDDGGVVEGDGGDGAGMAAVASGPGRSAHSVSGPQPPMPPPSLPPSLRHSDHANLSEMLLRNLSWILNASRGIDPSLLSRYANNRNVDGPAFIALIVAYALLIGVGAAGNGLVVAAVVRKPAMRTARNMFIVNLAVSDLLLCLVTMPLTLMEILTKYWPLGKHDLLCKTLATLQATSIFVSTISITAIALDRHRVIVYPTRESLQRLGAVGILGGIWVISALLAAPLFIWKTLRHHEINLPALGLTVIAYCLEDWPVDHGRAYYSLFSLLFQYLLPIITVSVAYSRICKKLRYRYNHSAGAVGSVCIGTSSGSGASGVGKGVSVNSAAAALAKGSQRRKKEEERRRRRTNSLLVSIALIFCVSWLPLNIYNLVVDLWNPFGDDRQTMMVIYAVCHMAGMSSACSNPLLYGWLNDNFRKEFKEILACLCPCSFNRLCPTEDIRLRMHTIRSSIRKKRHGAGGSGEADATVLGGKSGGGGTGGGGGGTGGSGDGDNSGCGDEGGAGATSALLGHQACEDGEGGGSGGGIRDTFFGGSEGSKGSGRKGSGGRKSGGSGSGHNYRRPPETMTTTENGIGGQVDTEVTFITSIAPPVNIFAP